MAEIGALAMTCFDKFVCLVSRRIKTPAAQTQHYVSNIIIEDDRWLYGGTAEMLSDHKYAPYTGYRKDGALIRIH